MSAGKPLTKTEKLLRARSVRNNVRFFINHQDPHVQEAVKERGYDPGHQALGHLIMARDKLNALIEELTGELGASLDRENP